MYSITFFHDTTIPVKKAVPVTNSEGWDSPHNPMKCLIKCIIASTTSYPTHKTYH